MSSIGTGYDLSASQFSPDGRVFQVEYAGKAVENSGTVIALKSKHGVVFAVEKIITSSLYESGSNKRIFNIDKHIGMAVAGLISDARQIVEFARKEAANYQAYYGQPIPLVYLQKRLSYYMHAHTLYSALRPYGCSVAVCSFDKVDKGAFYIIEPSGVSYAYFGYAIGKGNQTAKSEIEKIKTDDMTIEELINQAAKIIYIIHDEVKDKLFELELSYIKADEHIHRILPRVEVKAIEDKVKDSMNDEDDSDAEGETRDE